MTDASPEARIRHLFVAAFSREPTVTEIAGCLSALREVNVATGQATAGPESWTEICHALFGVKEFMYVR